MVNIFSCTCWPFYYLLGQVFTEILCPLKFSFSCFSLFCRTFLYNLEVNPVSDILLSDIFSTSEDFFSQSVDSFLVLKLFSLMYSHVCLLLLKCWLSELTWWSSGKALCPNAGVWLQSPVRELGSYMLHCVAKKKERKKKKDRMMVICVKMSCVISVKERVYHTLVHGIHYVKTYV